MRDTLAFMSFSENTLAGWTQAPRATETEKADRALSVVRTAVKNHDQLNPYFPSAFLQGSYRARTNVRQESDVDICVLCCAKTFFARYPAGKTKVDFGNTSSSIGFSDYKDCVERALKDRFGASSVIRGNKAFDVHANTYRLDADIVPTFEYRYYTGRTYSLSGSHEFYPGIAFRADDGLFVFNFPEQCYENGVAKNERCGRRYKHVVRILKHLRYHMQEDHIASADKIGSFLIECLVWNAPDEHFQPSTYTNNVRSVLVYTFNNTRKDADCAAWHEVDGIKLLFDPSQSWTREQAHEFLSDAWDYLGFE